MTLIPKDIINIIFSYVKKCTKCKKYKIFNEFYCNILLEDRIICINCYPQSTRYPYNMNDMIQTK